MKKMQPLVYAALITMGIYIGSMDNSTQVAVDSKLNNILQMINEHYVDSLNYTKFENNAINSILSELDPHSSYISIKDFKAIEEDMQGSFSGIGVEFNIIEDSIVVVSPISGGPSEKLGIQSGDRIIRVEKEDVASTGIKNEGVIKRLRGEKGSIVNIIIKRRGQNDLIPFAIVRDDIPLYSVDAGIMLINDIAYIKINRFSATTYKEMMEKINTLKTKGMQKLILDFRGNPGGYLHIANQICDEFLKAGELIVFTEGRNRSKQETFATQNGSLENIKVIVLINEGSASASEIVSGAFQDNERGLVIGRRSFGKGLVQEQITLNDGSVIRLTTQRYYTPSGRCIQKDYRGNTKDYYLEQYTRNDTSIHHSKSLKYTTKNGKIVYGGGGITPDIIIARDTNLNYLQINKMMSKGWINEFCFEKSETLKNQNISNYKQIDMDVIYAGFIQYLKQKDSKFKLKLGATEFKYLENLLLATISRNLWDNDTYYKVLSQEDVYIQMAINNF
ncbi:MAG: S41 family peptidase [Bacteroidota bacterium]|nr:S41 family peptidase [Bacteroidota bacterium]